MSVGIRMLIGLVALLAATPMSPALAVTATAAYTYDSVGRVTNVVYTESGSHVYVAYCYDTNGNRTGQMNSSSSMPTCPPSSREPGAAESSQLVPRAAAPDAQDRRASGATVEAAVGK